MERLILSFDAFSTKTNKNVPDESNVECQICLAKRKSQDDYQSQAKSQIRLINKNLMSYFRSLLYFILFEFWLVRSTVSFLSKNRNSNSSERLISIWVRHTREKEEKIKREIAHRMWLKMIQILNKLPRRWYFLLFCFTFFL